VTPLILRATEWELVRKIEEGGVQEFPAAEGDANPTTEIRAEALIEIIRGRNVQPPADAKIEVDDPNGRFPRPVVIRSAGIRLAHATIKGKLNLQDASGPGDSPLPRLRMENCFFLETIHLQRCRMRSLSLRKSRFSSLDARGAHISGEVDLTGVRGIGKGSDPGNFGQCWVQMSSAKIEDWLIAPFAQFMAPPRRASFVKMSQFARYALDLRAAEIKSSVILRPGCRALGGITLTLADVQGSVWVSGAELTGVEENAFAAEYSVIRGSIYLRTYDPAAELGNERREEAAVTFEDEDDAKTSATAPGQSTRFHAWGGVSVFACKLGGSLYMDGALVEPRGDKPKLPASENETIDIRNAEIGGDCNLCAWQSMSAAENIYEFKSAIEVAMDSARIRNELRGSGASMHSLSAVGIEVGANVNFCATFGKEQKRPLRFASDGNVLLTSARIGGDLLFCGAHIGPESQELASLDPAAQGGSKKNVVLSVAGSTIGGSCCMETYAWQNPKTRRNEGLRFVCNGVLRFSKARVTRSLRMDGAFIQARADSDRATLDLAGTFIGGDVYLRTWHDAETDVDQRAESDIRFEAVGGERVIRLDGAHIGQNLILNGSLLKANFPVEKKPELNAARSIYALSAVNAQIGGKAELSTFYGRDKMQPDFRFEARGLVSFAMASINMGLNLQGSLLTAAEAGNGKAGLPAKPPMEQVARYESIGIALDVSDAHLKFARLQRETWNDPPGRSPAFEAIGELNFSRIRTDAEVDLTSAVVHGAVVAPGAKIGAGVNGTFAALEGPLNLTGAQIEGELDLRESKLYGGLHADGVRVQENVILESATLPSQSITRAIVVEKLAGTVMGGTVRDWILEEHVTRTLVPDVSFQDGHIGHALQISKLRVCTPSMIFPSCAKLMAHQDLLHCTVDLRGLHVGELKDEGGLGWGNQMLLWLDGFRYDRLAEVSVHSEKISFSDRVRRAADRFLDPSCLSTIGKEALRRPVVVNSPDPTARRVRLNTLEHWERRLVWLNLQYFGPLEPDRREYTPDGYERMIAGLNAIGSFHDARRIASKQQTLENRFKRGWLPLLWLRQRLWDGFRIGFDYGFSATRAFVLLILCLFTGWLSATYLDRVWTPDHKCTYLVMKPSSPEARYSYDDSKLFLIEPPPNVHKGHPQPYVPCGKGILPALYALDVFVPALNLHQQDACSIIPEAPWWRVGQASYAVLGWTVVPLALLTFSGILRRYWER
jgi:hypothetical protein